MAGLRLELLQELFQAPVGGGVDDGDLSCERGDEFVAAVRRVRRDAARAGREAGYDQQAAGCEVRLPGRRDAEASQAAGGADDDGARAAQQDGQTFLLDRRMETAEDSPTRVFGGVYTVKRRRWR